MTRSSVSTTDVTFTDVREPVYYGPDVVTALRWVRRFACTNEVMRSLNPGSAERTLDRLREMIPAHEGADGIWFDARAWIVATRRVLSRSGADLQPVAR
jgi:hypothetical protein